MSDWYVSSVAYTAVTQWSATTAFATGAIVRQLATPATNSERCFRVTAGGGGNSGGSEPTWVLTSNGTTTDGALTWTECTAQSNHQQDNGVTNTWTAPAARLNNITSNGKNVLASLDRVFFSSDHAETQATTLLTPTAFSLVYCISVSRTAGNIPPLAADITNGASMTTTGSAHDMTLQLGAFWQGFTFTAGTSGNSSIKFIANRMYLKDCTVVAGDLGVRFNTPLGLVWDNVTYKVPAVGAVIDINSVSGTLVDFEWRGGSVVSNSGTLPTNLFHHFASGGSSDNIRLRGVDLSVLGSGKTIMHWQTASGSNSTSGVSRQSLRNCKLGASVTVTNGPDEATGVFGSVVEVINCDSGNTNYNNSWYYPGGSVVTETTITRTNGATDGTTKVSRKMVTLSGPPPIFTEPLEHHIWQWNTTTGVSKTATIEFISSTTLNNDEIWGELEYLADTSDALSAFGNNYKATVLTTGAAQTSSSTTWDSSPATPVKQKLAITFTPQKVGLMHFTVRLAKVSTTVYVDPLITLT